MDIQKVKLYIDCNKCDIYFTATVEPWTEVVKCPFCGDETLANVSVLVTNATGKQVIQEINKKENLWNRLL